MENNLQIYVDIHTYTHTHVHTHTHIYVIEALCCIPEANT